MPMPRVSERIGDTGPPLHACMHAIERCQLTLPSADCIRTSAPLLVRAPLSEAEYGLGRAPPSAPGEPVTRIETRGMPSEESMLLTLTPMLEEGGVLPGTCLASDHVV